MSTKESICTPNSPDISTCIFEMNLLEMNDVTCAGEFLMLIWKNFMGDLNETL